MKTITMLAMMGLSTVAVAAPKAADVDKVAIAECKDGAKSYAKGHRGACSRHGGVAKWLDGSELKAPKTAKVSKAK